MAKQKKIIGAEAFEAYYSNLYKNEWPVLKESLYKETKYFEFKFSKDCESYFLDGASVCAGLCLPVRNAEKILDLCAAPGGKTLVVSSTAFNNGKETFLTSNERSFDRFKRLERTVQTCVPVELQGRIKTQCSDGSVLCKKINSEFDSILLDAPCSSERHVLQDSKYLNQWTPNRVKTMTFEQHALISSAVRMLKTGGYLLYATCALATDENDGTISKLLKKNKEVQPVDFDTVSQIFKNNLDVSQKYFSGQVTLESIFNSAIKTQYGFHVLPHRCNGFGPLFFGVLKKI